MVGLRGHQETSGADVAVELHARLEPEPISRVDLSKEVSRSHAHRSDRGRDGGSEGDAGTNLQASGIGRFRLASYSDVEWFETRRGVSVGDNSQGHPGS